jgi:hypothetical protein
VVPFAAGIYVTGFHFPGNIYPCRQKAPKNAVDSGVDGDFSGGAPYHRYYVPFLNQIPDFSPGLKDTVCAGAEEALGGIAAYVAGYACVGKGAPFGNDPAQGVAPFGFDYRMTVKAGAKAGAHGDYHRSVVYGSAGVFFCYYRVDEYRGFVFFYDVGFGIDKEGNFFLGESPPHFSLFFYQDRPYVLHPGAAFVDGPAKRDGPADSGGRGCFGHRYIETGMMETQRDSRREIA